MRTWASVLDGTGLRIAAVASRFNHLISLRLLDACRDELRRRGVAEEDLHLAWVPGAFEIPAIARALAASGRYDAVVAVGCVIRGDTPHFDYVCRAVTDGVREAARDTGVPVIFGVLTTDDVDQALARAGMGGENRGVEFARAAVEMAHLRRAIEGPPGARR